MTAASRRSVQPSLADRSPGPHATAVVGEFHDDSADAGLGRLTDERTGLQASPAVTRRALMRLQRTAGNRAVRALVASRSLVAAPGERGSAASTHRRQARTGGARGTAVLQRQLAGAAKAFGWQGVTVSADKAAVRTQLEGLVEGGGLEGLRRWYGSYAALDRGQKKAFAAAFQLTDADLESIDAAVRDADRALEDDARAFADDLKPAATTIAEGILSASEERIQKELDRYGISEVPVEPPGGGGASGAPAAYDTQISLDNADAAKSAQGKARELAAARRAADKAQVAFMRHVEVPGKSDVEKVVKEQVPGLETEYQQAEELWKMSEDLYAKQAVAATAEFPVLSMYATGDAAAAQLEGFASQPVEQLGETIWREARTRLDNIGRVRAELGSTFDPLANDRIVKLVLEKEGVKPWQRRVGRDHIEARQARAAEDKMFWATIAIGLGIVAAIPTGGSSVAAGIGTAAAIAGAALGVFNAYENWKAYQVESAAAKTDFAQAEALAKDEPSFLWLAVDLIAAGLGVVAAGVAFKNLVGVIKEARKARDILKMAEAIDAAAPPAMANKIKATVAAEMGPDAVTELVVAEGAKFRSGDLLKVRRSLEQSAIEGWTDAYDAMAAQGRLRPLTEDALEATLGHLAPRDPAFSSLADEYIQRFKVLRNQGVYSPEADIVFVKPGGQHTVANVVAHEMVHAGQARMGAELNGFWAEFEALSAQKRIILALDRAGVGSQIEARVAWIRSASDTDLALFIKNNYGYQIPKGVGGFSPESDRQIARAAIAAAKRILAVGGS